MTTETMKQDIAVAIQKNLSAEIGAALQDELTELAGLRKAVKVWNETVAKLEGQLGTANKALEIHGALATREAVIIQRETAVGARERDRDVIEAKLQATESNKRADLAVSLVQTVFRSPVFTRTFNESNSVQVPIPSGTYMQQQTELKSGSESVRTD